MASFGGCSVIAPDAEPASSFPDTDCGKVGRQRAQDAAVNGYDEALQASVGRDAYAACQANLVR